MQAALVVRARVPRRGPEPSGGDADAACRELAAAVAAGWRPDPDSVAAFFRARRVPPSDGLAAFARVTGATPWGLARIHDRVRRLRAAPPPPERPADARMRRAVTVEPAAEREPDFAARPAWKGAPTS